MLKVGREGSRRGDPRFNFVRWQGGKEQGEGISACWKSGSKLCWNLGKFVVEPEGT